MKTDRDGRNQVDDYIRNSGEDPVEWNVANAAYQLAQLNRERGNTADPWNFDTLGETDFAMVLSANLVS